MEHDEIVRAADILIEHRLARRALPELPADCRPAGEDDAYAIQDVMNERLEARGEGAVAGHKIGCTTPVMQQYMGIDHPGGGAVLAPTAHRETATLPRSEFVNIGIETEIAILLADDLPADGAPYDLQAILDATGECMAAFELVDARYVDFRELDVWTMIADDFFNAGAVLAAPIADWRGLDLKTVEGVIRVDGVEAGRGVGGNVEGHPFESAVWLANTLARRGSGLKSGEFILTGSIIETQWFDATGRAEAEISGLGAVSVEFV